MAIESGGQDTSDSRLTAVAGHATADTKGSYVELIASTSQANEWITIEFGENATGADNFLVDIATGAAASEVVLIADIPVWCKSGSPVGLSLGPLPITIASGTRISARCQSNTGGDTIEVGVHLSNDASFGTSDNVDSLGSDTTNSRGVTVDPGAVANTKGSYAELIASTADDYGWIVVCVGYNENAAQAAAYFLIDIATGAAASETVIVQNIHFVEDAFEIGGDKFFPYQVPIASGARVSVRAQCNITDATDRLIDVAVLGSALTAPAGGSASGVRNPLGGPI